MRQTDRRLTEYDHAKGTPQKAQNGEDGDDRDINFKYSGFGLCWICDGPCNTPRSDYAEIWICAFCGYSAPCEKCIDWQRRDEISVCRCDAKPDALICIYPMILEAIEMFDTLIERRFDV